MNDNMNNNNSNILQSITSKYDPNFIIQSAQKELNATNSTSSTTSNNNSTPNGDDLVRGQMIFQQALMDWTDDYREGLFLDDIQNATTNSNSTNNLINLQNHIKEIVQESIITLYIGYCEYLINAKQYKTAIDMYEQSLNEWPHSCKLYLNYIRFAEERKKIKLCQSIFIRALIGNTNSTSTSTSTSSKVVIIEDEQDRELLWNEFLQLMQQKNPTLTLNELQIAVTEQQQQKEEQEMTQTQSMDADDNNDNNNETLESNDTYNPLESTNNQSNKRNIDNDITTSTDVAQVPIKKKLNTSIVSTADNSAEEVVSRTHVVLEDSIVIEVNNLLQRWSGNNSNNGIPGMMSSILSTSTIASSTNISNCIKLPSDVVAAWMILDGNDTPSIIDTNIFLFTSTIPKLSDPTGTELLGLSVAISIIDRLLDSTSSDTSGNLLLHICNSLWTIQGLKIIQTTTELDNFDKQKLEQYEQLELIFTSRIDASSTNTTDNVLRNAVEQMNTNERTNFQNTVSQQRTQLLTKIIWEYRTVLYLQQIILRQLNVPGFTSNSLLLDDDSYRATNSINKSNSTNNNNNSSSSSSSATAVDRITLQKQSNVCKYLHSAFYIRSRMGIESHEKTLQNQLKRLQKEYLNQQQQNQQQQNQQQQQVQNQQQNQNQLVSPIMQSTSTTTSSTIPAMTQQQLPPSIQTTTTTTLQQQQQPAFQQLPIPSQYGMVQQVQQQQQQPPYPATSYGTMYPPTTGYAIPPQQQQQQYYYPPQQQQPMMMMPQGQQQQYMMPPTGFPMQQQQQQQQQQQLPPALQYQYYLQQQQPQQPPPSK